MLLLVTWVFLRVYYYKRAVQILLKALYKLLTFILSSLYYKSYGLQGFIPLSFACFFCALTEAKVTMKLLAIYNQKEHGTMMDDVTAKDIKKLCR